MERRATPRQVAFLNTLLDQAWDQNLRDEALDRFNEATGEREANIGHGGTGLRKRLHRLTITQASAAIDALKAL